MNAAEPQIDRAAAKTRPRIPWRLNPPRLRSTFTSLAMDAKPPSVFKRRLKFIKRMNERW